MLKHINIVRIEIGVIIYIILFPNLFFFVIILIFTIIIIIVFEIDDSSVNGN